MGLIKTSRGRFWGTLLCFVVMFIIITMFIFVECRHLAIRDAEKNLAGFLLNHSATRLFVEDVQKQEIYRLKNEGQLYPDYFSPKLLSATFIARHINELQNAGREKHDLEEIYFKFASQNPRNPENLADDSERELLKAFNEGSLTKYKEVVRLAGETVLYYAVPVDPNRESCMLCHGDPAAAPGELIERYGDHAGFYEKVGDIRALMSVRVPLSGTLARANQTALLLSTVTFLLLSGSFWIVQYFYRKIEAQEKIAVEKSYFLNSILQSSTETAIIATDLNCRILYINRAAEKLGGLTAKEAMEGDLFDLLHRLGDGSIEALKEALSFADKRGSYNFSYEFQGRILDTRISRIPGARRESAGFLLIGQDMTGRILEEQEREQIKVRLQKAEKMESIGLMAGGVAHDLNNILAGIISYPELLLLKLPQDSELRSSIEAIQKSGERASAVVADLLTIARGVAIQKCQADLNALTREYLESPEFKALQARYPAVRCDVALGDEPMHIFCSPLHVKKCIMNLVGNAFEAMNETGHCLIAGGVRSLDLHSAHSFRIKQGSYCYISVSDTGPGIDKKDINQIFEPFYSTKKMGRSGTGLGLSVVWNTVKDHQGAVSVDSDESGTTFSLFFPQNIEAHSGQESRLGKDDLHGSGEKVLVVDDEAQLRDIAEQFLAELKYSAVTAKSGEEALQLLETERFDLILLDMLLGPGISGRETFEEIVARRPDQKVIIVSGFSSHEDINYALEHGARDYLSKPYSIDSMGTLIKGILKS